MIAYGYLNIIGAETGDLGEIVPQSNVSSSTFARTGAYSFAVASSPTVSAGQPIASFAVPEIASNGAFSGGTDHAYYLRFYAYLSSLPTLNDVLNLATANGWQNSGFGINVTPNGSVQVSSSSPGATGVSAAGVVSPGSWIRFDIAVTISMVSGGYNRYDMTIFVNGSAVAWTTGGALSKWIPGYSFNLGAQTQESDNITVYFDDIALTQNQRAMSGGVLLLKPSGYGSNGGWCAYSPTNYTRINGIPPEHNVGLVQTLGGSGGSGSAISFNVTGDPQVASFGAKTVVLSQKSLSFFYGPEGAASDTIYSILSNSSGVTLSNYGVPGNSGSLFTNAIVSESSYSTGYPYNLHEPGFGGTSPDGVGALGCYLVVDVEMLPVSGGRIFTGGRLLNSPLRTGGAL